MDRAILPPELLSQIFLEVDPHTLYTSVRALSRSWKQCVEQRLLASEFESGRWRVGLRVVRKPKMGAEWRGGRAGGRGLEAPGALWDNVKSYAQQRASELQQTHTQSSSSSTDVMDEARSAFARNVVSRHGALEDELEPVLADDEQEPNAPIVHVIPMNFKRYDSNSTTLQFTTPSDELYALFERDASRLDLDFGIVWRFPGDGQSNDGWGDADPENGWLSRFYCSSFDVHNKENDVLQEDRNVSLRSTPLARRVRRAIAHCDDEEVESGDEDGEPEANTSHARISAHSQLQRPLEWSDRGHEYASLSLSLGTEFFVRRSARANFLLRRLEAEVEANHVRRQARRNRKFFSSTASTPRRSPRQCLTPSLVVPASGHSRIAGSPSRSVKSATPLKSSSTCSTGTSTPSWPPWKTGASFAAVASTPPSESASHRGSFSASGRGNGPRILRPVPISLTSTGRTAPQPSVNASGYASVQHRSPTDEKEAELKQQEIAAGIEDADSAYAALGDMTRSTSSSSSCSTKGCASAKVAISSHQSVPRAHFSARLLRAMPTAGPKNWQGGDAWGRNSQRQATFSGQESIVVWEWCR